MAKSVAIVGGGITGTTLARCLSQTFEGRLSVSLFDQGQRGFGGRTSHRRVDIATQAVLLDESGSPKPRQCDAFDHGCQFFFASPSTSSRFKQGALAEWLTEGVVTSWEERRVLWCTSDTQQQGDCSTRDFFGILANDAGNGSTKRQPCYVGVGGMHKIARHQAAVAERHGATLYSATRVASVRAGGGGLWELVGTSNAAAFHNTAEAVASSQVQEQGYSSLGKFDAVIFTDASSSYQNWHRASAGAAEIVPEMTAFIASRPRIPLFSAMLTIDRRVAPEFDCIVFENGPVWYACRSNTKPGFGGTEVGGERDSWTLISTPAFACEEIGAVPMVDVSSSTGSKTFRPQENNYLNSQGGPADVLSKAFLESEAVSSSASASPSILYLQGQRWGSAIPGSIDLIGTAPSSSEHLHEIGETIYQSKVPDLTPREPLNSDGGDDFLQQDFLKDDAQRIYYAGDFVSKTRVPGVEAAVLSAEDCAQHVGFILTGTLGVPLP